MSTEKVDESMGTERPPLAAVIDNVARRVEYGLFAVSAVILAGLAAVVFYATLARRLGWDSAWVLEISEYSMVTLTFFAAAWLLRTDGHVSIDILERYLGHRVSRLMNVGAACVIIAVCLILSVASMHYVLYLHEREALRIATLVVPEWLVYLPIAIGAVVLLLESVLRLLRATAGTSEEEPSQDGMAS